MKDSAIAIEYGLIAAGFRLAAIRRSRTPVIKLAFPFVPPGLSLLPVLPVEQPQLCLDIAAA